MPRAYPNCCICFSNDENEWSSLKCGHVFHTVCLSQSLRQCGKKCPKCRKDGSKPQRLFLEFEEDQGFVPTQTGDAAFQSLQTQHQQLNVEHTQLRQKAADLEDETSSLRKKVQKLQAQENSAELEKSYLRQRLYEAQQAHKFALMEIDESNARHDKVIADMKSQVNQMQSQLDDEKAKSKQLESIRQSKVIAERVAKNPKLDPVVAAELLESCNQEDLKRLYQTRTAEFVKERDKAQRLEKKLSESNEELQVKLTAAERKAHQEKESLGQHLERTKRKLNQYELELMNLRAQLASQPRADAPESFSLEEETEIEPTPEDLNAGEEDQTQEDFEDFENEDPDPIIPTRVRAKPGLMGFAKRGANTTDTGPSFMGKVDPYLLTAQNNSARLGRALAPLSGNKFRAAALQGPPAKKAKKSKAGGVATLHRFGFCNNNTTTRP